MPTAAYDLNGNLRSWSLTGRATALHVYSYDELNRLTTLTRQNFTEPMTWNYVTDKTGRKTTDNAKFRWEYDALGRLTREQYDANTNWTLDSANDYITTFAYDLVGNRKKKVTDKLGTTSDETVTYVYNSRDELTSETSTLSGTTTYIYDANGSLTSKTKGAAVETYGYDKRNKMTSYTSSSGVTTTYKYDDNGLRVQRKVGTAAATLYLLNHHNLTGYAVVMEERSGTNTSVPTVAYVIGHDVLRQSQDAASTGTTDGHLHLIYDGQGNVRGNVGTVNVGPTSVFVAVGGFKDYSAFGELISSSMLSNLRHHGEYFDGITGFYFQGVRQRVTHWWTQMDDPRIGRNIEPLTLHKYGFVHQDPVNGIDPSGLESLSGKLAVVGILGFAFAMTTAAIMPYLRNPSTPIGPGQFVPVDFNKVEAHYHSIRIRNAIGGADAVFADMRRFSQLNMYPVKASGDISGVGGIVSFDMTPIFKESAQGDFEAKVTKFDAQERFFVVRTLAGHPLAGWRYWGVKELSDGDILVETFSIEHAATQIDQWKLYAGGMKAMYGTWTTFLRDIVRRSGGAEVADNDSDPTGYPIGDIQPYLDRVVP